MYSPKVGRLYPLQIYIFQNNSPNPAPEGRTETLQLTYVPQVLAEYIQYQYIYSTYKYSHIVSSIYPMQMLMSIPQPCTRGRTETLQLTYIPQVLEEYIQYQYLY